MNLLSIERFLPSKRQRSIRHLTYFVFSIALLPELKHSKRRLNSYSFRTSRFRGPNFGFKSNLLRLYSTQVGFL